VIIKVPCDTFSQLRITGNFFYFPRVERHTGSL
jgi:hypothetical protein